VPNPGGLGPGADLWLVDLPVVQGRVGATVCESATMTREDESIPGIIGDSAIDLDARTSL